MHLLVLLAAAHTATTVCNAAEPPATPDPGGCPAVFQKCTDTSDCDNDVGG